MQIGPDHIIYTGDGSSDINVMLHVKMRDGFTIAVSEAKHVSQIAKRTVLSTNALAVLGPILEETVGWERPQIRQFFEAYGILIQEWDSVRTDWLTLRPAVKDLSRTCSCRRQRLQSLIRLLIATFRWTHSRQNSID